MKMRFRKIMAAILSTAMVAAAIPASGILNVQAKSPQEHIDLSRQVAGEGMVLMENDGALPLAQGEKVAMLGRAMIDYVRGGLFAQHSPGDADQGIRRKGHPLSAAGRFLYETGQ